MAYYIGPRCSCCHYCNLECPTGAIRFSGTSYEIDAAKCIGCGICAKVCPAGIIYDPEHPNVPEPHDQVEMQADIVVLGGGGSGLVAAVRAAQTGKRVIVLEKAAKIGGNTNLGHGFMLRWSKWHEAAGLPDVRQEFVDTLYQDTGKQLDYQLLKNATYALSDMFDWLCEFGGAEEHFRLQVLKDPPPDQALRVLTGMIDMPKRIDNLKCTEESMGPGWMGTYVIRTMEKAAKELGVEIVTGVKAEHLLLDEHGKFVGVAARDAGGRYRVQAKACVIATGGFAHNDNLMEKCNPDFFKGQPVKRLSVAGTTGDGIAMVEEIGGEIDLKHVRVPAGGPVHHPWSSAVMDLTGYCNPTVDVNGKLLELLSVVPGQPTSALDQVEGCVVYQILDKDGVETNIRQQMQRRREESPEKDYLGELEYEARLGVPVKKAWTLEGLAEKIGAKPAILIESMRKYNAMVAQTKTDESKLSAGAIMMGSRERNSVKNGPFYAICQGRFSESASGGIAIDSGLRVLRTDESAIPGLYAVGDSARGLFLPDDSGGKFGEMPWAMASGFLAGKYAAEFAAMSGGEA